MHAIHVMYVLSIYTPRVCVCVFVVYIARTESTAAQQQQQQQQQQEDHEAVLPSRESRSMYLQSPRQGTHM
jgi:hypothetical protein